MSVVVSSSSSPCSFPSSASIIFNSSNSNLTTTESLSQIQRRAALYPLHDAASWDHFHNLKLLLQNGADVNQQESKEGNTPLHFAAKAGLRSERCLRLLLAFGADPTRKNSNGETPSAFMTDARLLQFLLQKEEEHALRKEGQLRIYDPNLACARWRLTKCMLRGGFLYCYSANQKSSIEVILHLVAADVNTAEHTTKRQHTFLLRAPDTTLSGLSSTSEDLCYFFQASSEPEMAGWISALRQNSTATTNELEMKQPQEKSETLASLAIVFVNVPEGLDDEEDETSGSIVPTEEEGGRKEKGSIPSSSSPFSTSPPSSASPLSSLPSSVDFGATVTPLPLSPATVRFLEGTGGVSAREEEEEEEVDEAIVIPSISTRERSVSSLRLGNIISSSNRTVIIDPSPLVSSLTFSSSIAAVNSPSEGIVPRNFTTSFLPSSSSSAVASSPAPSSLSSPSLSSETPTSSGKKAEFLSMLDSIDKEQEQKEKRSSTARIKRRLSSGKRGALTGKTSSANTSLESINSPRKTTPPQPPLPSSTSSTSSRGSTSSIRGFSSRSNKQQSTPLIGLSSVERETLEKTSRDSNSNPTLPCSPRELYATAAELYSKTRGGFLWINSHKRFGAWRLRWALVRDQELLFFKKQVEPTDTKKSVGKIKLHKVQKVEAIRDIGKRENCFALHTTSRTTNLQALSMDDRSEWIRMIHEVTARLRPSAGVFTSPRLLPGSASSKFSPFSTSPSSSSSYLPTSSSTSTASLRLAQLSRGSLASDISECSVAFDNSSATSLCCSDFDSGTDPTNSDRISRSKYTGSLGRAGTTTGGTGTETTDDLSLSELSFNNTTTTSQMTHSNSIQSTNRNSTGAPSPSSFGCHSPLASYRPLSATMTNRDVESDEELDFNMFLEDYPKYFWNTKPCNGNVSPISSLVQRQRTKRVH